MSDQYLKNFSYLFVPFTAKKLEQFPGFCDRIAGEKLWKSVGTKDRYLHRYVSEKITKYEKANCYHYELNKELARERGVFPGEMPYGTAPKEYLGVCGLRFDFSIANVELFLFGSAIGILAFELRFREDDPRRIAAAQYYLRKISTEKIFRLDDPEDVCGERFVDISTRLLESDPEDRVLDFFFYAVQGNERANFLTYIDVPAQKSYGEELFYLKWCYNDGFEYDEDLGDNEDNENYTAGPNIHWGISVSAAVCLVNRSKTQKEFVERVFQTNFRNQYLFTYILLLHQKYMMYLFLTKMARGLEGNLELLEKYKELLYDFETHYMFSYISEVPQYQRLYQKVRRVFALEKLFQDVQEPLLQLTEIQKQQAEKEQRDHDHRLNAILTVLSLLTIVSALTDATGITANLGWLIPQIVSRIIQLVTLGGVFCCSIVMLIRLLFLKKR